MHGKRTTRDVQKRGKSGKLFQNSLLHLFFYLYKSPDLRDFLISAAFYGYSNHSREKPSSFEPNKKKRKNDFKRELKQH